MKYGMRLRGFAPGCQPMDGLVKRHDDLTKKYHGILEYNRELTDEELRKYELDRLRKAKCIFCDREETSSEDLPFFDKKPDEETDNYYCGCIGWE